MTEDADSPEARYQPEQTGMYELEFPAPQLSSADGSGPVMIHALEGFSDAGHASLSEHLRQQHHPFWCNHHLDDRHPGHVSSRVRPGLW